MSSDETRTASGAKAMAQTTQDAMPSDRSVEPHPDELPNEDDQRGVRDFEAVTLVWSKMALILIFTK